MRCVLSHVSGSTAILATQCQALQHAQDDQDHWRGHPDAGVVGQDTHDEGRGTHQQDGHQEGVLAPDHVAQSTKDQRAKRPHDETGSKSQQGENEG